MEKDCMNCGEPWDVYYLMHEEGLIKQIKILLSENDYGHECFLEANGFKIQELCGWNEVPEGHFLIHNCPTCRDGNELI